MDHKTEKEGQNNYFTFRNCFVVVVGILVFLFLSEIIDRYPRETITTYYRWLFNIKDESVQFGYIDVLYSPVRKVFTVIYSSIASGLIFISTVSSNTLTNTLKHFIIIFIHSRKYGFIQKLL